MNSSINFWFLRSGQAESFSDSGFMMVRVSGHCVFCKRAASTILAPLQFDEACAGNTRSIKSVRDREFLISGICHECQIPVFEDDEPEVIEDDEPEHN